MKNTHDNQSSLLMRRMAHYWVELTNHDGSKAQVLGGSVFEIEQWVLKVRLGLIATQTTTEFFRGYWTSDLCIRLVLLDDRVFTSVSASTWCRRQKL